jgi:RHS repeat-associated protein
LVTYGKFSYTYSPNGELATKTNTTNSQVTAYTYDDLGNLRAVALPDGRLIEYVVDGMNRRIGKKVDGQLVRGWLYRDGLKPAAETDGAGVVTAVFVYGDHKLSPAYIVKAGSIYRVVRDAVGPPRRIVDVATGSIAESIDVDEFGNVISDSAPGFQPFGFQGGIADSDTALVRFGARDYSSDIGRWTCKDLAGFNGRDGDLYAFVHNDPINAVDPDGLKIVVLGNDPALLQALANIEANPTLQPLIEQLENSAYEIALISSAPTDEMYEDSGGSTRVPPSDLFSIDIELNWTVNQGCPFPADSLEELVAHELGHAFAYIEDPLDYFTREADYVTLTNLTALEFQNAIRDLAGLAPRTFHP